jgi:hypothetical protein
MSPTETIDVAQLKDAISTAIQEEGFWETPNHCIDATTTTNNDIKANAVKVCAALLSDDAALKRLLVARKHEKAATISLFWEQVRFQARLSPQSITPADLPTSLPSGAWRLCGRTKSGHVLSNYKLALWDPDSYGDDLELAVAEYTKYVCYMIELINATSSLSSSSSSFNANDNGSNTKHDKSCLIWDLNGFYVSMAAKANVRAMVRKIIYVAQAQYPERVEKIYMINAPFGFSTAWSLVSVLLDQKTASKVEFCSKENLLEDIDIETLSTAYGGLHPEYPIPSKTIQEEANTNASG